MSITFKLVNQDGNYAAGEVDVALDGIGRMVSLDGSDKLIEDVQKILFTEINQFHENYGTAINDLVGSNLGLESIKQTLAKRVTDSLVYLQLLQADQQKYQDVDAGELLASINRIAVTYLGEVTGDERDVFTFEVNIEITNGLGDTLSATKNFALGGK